MSDRNFHEIQLSGKQLIFLFMCAVVLAVVVFLFGVSIGREVKSSAGDSAEAATSGTTAVDVPPAAGGTPPPSTPPAANELSYAEALEGRGGDPSKATPPPPAPEPPPSTPPASAPAKAGTPAPPPAAKAATKTVPALNGWVVQVGAFNANDIAGKEVAKLQGKGYPAFVFTEAESVPGPRYKVRVGPYSARPEADRILKDLTKEGYKPLLKR